MSIGSRLAWAARFAAAHLLGSVVLAGLAALLIFAVWYPRPYMHLSGGDTLFWLIVGVDVICGPLLTLILFTPSKPRAELARDFALVVMVQLGALGYGLYTLWVARPLFLVAEMDRFKVIAFGQIRSEDQAALPEALTPKLWQSPQQVSVKIPSDFDEKMRIVQEVLNGGPDLGERPQYYVPYDAAAAAATWARGKPLARFLQTHGEQQPAAAEIAAATGQPLTALRYLPMVARQQWVVVLAEGGRVVGFLKGDGFEN